MDDLTTEITNTLPTNVPEEWDLGLDELFGPEDQDDDVVADEVEGEDESILHEDLKGRGLQKEARWKVQRRRDLPSRIWNFKSDRKSFPRSRKSTSSRKGGRKLHQLSSKRPETAERSKQQVVGSPKVVFMTDQAGLFQLVEHGNPHTGTGDTWRVGVHAEGDGSIRLWVYHYRHSSRSGSELKYRRSNGFFMDFRKSTYIKVQLEEGRALFQDKAFGLQIVLEQEEVKATRANLDQSGRRVLPGSRPRACTPGAKRIRLEGAPGSKEEQEAVPTVIVDVVRGLVDCLAEEQIWKKTKFMYETQVAEKILDFFMPLDTSGVRPRLKSTYWRERGLLYRRDSYGLCKLRKYYPMLTDTLNKKDQPSNFVDVLQLLCEDDAFRTAGAGAWKMLKALEAHKNKVLNGEKVDGRKSIPSIHAARDEVTKESRDRFKAFANGFEGRVRTEKFPTTPVNRRENAPKCEDVLSYLPRQDFLRETEKDEDAKKPSFLCTGVAGDHDRNRCTLVHCYTPKETWESGSGNKFNQGESYWQKGDQKKTLFGINLNIKSLKATEGNPKFAYEVEHILDRSRGGPNAMSNFVFTWGKVNVPPAAQGADSFTSQEYLRYWDKVYGKTFWKLTQEVRDWCDNHVLTEESVEMNGEKVFLEEKHVKPTYYPQSRTYMKVDVRFKWIKRHFTNGQQPWHATGFILDPKSELFEKFSKAEKEQWAELINLGEQLCEEKDTWYVDELNAELYS